MKKRNILLSLLLASAIILAACGPSQEESGEGTPSVTQPGGYPEMTEPVGGSQVTQPVGTPEMTESFGTPETTEAVSTPQVTESVITPTVQTTLPVTGTEALPATGFIDPGRVSNLLDFNVWNQNDEQIGEVQDLVLNLETTHVDYVIVKMGGSLDTTGKLIAIPCEALTVVSAQAQSASANGPQNGFVLNVDQSKLDNAPEINLDNVPELGGQAEGWDADIRSYWQDIISAPATTSGTATPSTTTGQTGLAGVVLASKMLDVSFQAANGAASAASMSVDDVLVDVESCEIKYVVLSASSTATGEMLIPIPLKILGWDASNKAFVPNVDPQALLQAPGFEVGKYPPTITPDWDANLRSYWEKYISPGS